MNPSSSPSTDEGKGKAGETSPSQTIDHDDVPRPQPTSSEPTTVRTMPTVRIPSGPTLNTASQTASASSHLVSVVCCRADFEAGYNVVQFAQKTCHLNDFRRNHVGKVEVEHLFHVQVRSAYGHREDMVDKLLNQVSPESYDCYMTAIYSLLSDVMSKDA